MLEAKIPLISTVGRISKVVSQDVLADHTDAVNVMGFTAVIVPFYMAQLTLKIGRISRWASSMTTYDSVFSGWQKSERFSV